MTPNRLSEVLPRSHDAMLRPSVAQGRRHAKYRPAVPVWKMWNLPPVFRPSNRAGRWLGTLLCLWVVMSTVQVPTNGQSFDLGGSLRGYQFFQTEKPLPFQLSTRRDTEFFSFRMTLDTQFSSQVQWETHLVLDWLSPPRSGVLDLAAGSSQPHLPLQHQFRSTSNHLIAGRLDRFNFQLDLDRVNIVVGRQAISWGVTYFFSVLDLFSNFAPHRIDRDYKEGVDAVRVTVPVGKYSEVQVIGAALGRSLDRRGALAAQARLHLGALDLGLMGGRFHQDTVAGGFLTTDVRGTALRGEFSWTHSVDPRDRLLGRSEFWRATLGVDRQLTPQISTTLELSYNGFGTSRESEYLSWAESDRVLRGEMPTLGASYGGLAFNWQLHPLWTVTQSLLVNWQDPSALWIPALQWSTSNNSSVLLAVQTGFGGTINPASQLESEYGAAPTTLLAAVKWYF